MGPGENTVLASQLMYKIFELFLIIQLKPPKVFYYLFPKI